MKSPSLLFGFLVVASPLFTSSPSRPNQSKIWWSTLVAKALSRSGPNLTELITALEKVPKAQREGMAFLIANMPDRDLKTLAAEFLLDNVSLAYRAKAQLPWGKSLPKEIFLNYVLPYVNVDENRDPWRKELFDLCLPLVKHCKTPAEAAQVLNAKVFKKLKVRYSTRRKKPHQSPKESIASGLASCTGLSILLCDACRSVAVPARLVGTPQWTNVRGNHTWVEIWDNRWHFTGACEPDPRGLNHAWFVGRASQAKKESKLHAIYATSYRRTNLTFPLVWDIRNQEVSAVNVTDRYTQKKKSAAPQQGLSHEQTQRIREAAQDYFNASRKEQAEWRFDPNLDRWLAENEKTVRELVWESYRSSPIHKSMKQDFNGRKVRYRNYVSPYTVKQVGMRPKDGWPLFIAMHGGGGVPKRINDSQWRVMQRYYRDQKSVTGYKYLALRAPNDTWNGFYDNYVPPLIANLIRQFLLYGDVDSDKVFLLGYSHGGYGAFFIGPKIPHRFAAIHASAAAPTPGTISPRCLRNTRFTFMIGEHDKRYERRQRCEKFNREIQKLKSKRKDIYPVEMEFKKGHGHTGLPDRDKIRNMYPCRRNPVPKHITWDLTDSVNKQFFWLTVPHPARGQSIEAIVHGNDIALKTKNVGEFELYLDERLVDFAKPLKISLNGSNRVAALRHSFLALCQSLHQSGDPKLAFAYRIRLPAK